MAGENKPDDINVPPFETDDLRRNLVRRNDGRTEELSGCAHTVLEAGEAFTVVTPTGGGYGRS